MNIVNLALALAAAVLSLAARSLMKRYLARKAGKVVPSLLEADFWKATADRPVARVLLAVELASWAATVAMVVALASEALGQ
jgi:hypothetical protein